MSAVFAGLFGTPLTAALFCMEFESVGTLFSPALLPCYIASFTAAKISGARFTIYRGLGARLERAVINFFLVATVLFIIVKVINTVRESQRKALDNILDDFPTRAERKEMKKLHLNFRDAEVLTLYRKEKADAEKAKAEEKARKQRLENPTTEDLLKDILAVLKEGKENKTTSGK